MPPPKRSSRARTQLAAQLVRFDPEFSLVLFEDFVYALYARVHELRGKQRDYREVAPYLAPRLVPPNSGGEGLTDVRGIIIGAMAITDASVSPDGAASVTVEIESNYEEVVRGLDGPRAYYAREQWTLARRAGLRSKPPERARSIGCPNCGAPLRDLREATCSYCKTRIDPGVFDWQVLTMTELERTPRAPELTGTTEEQGTDLPTVISPQASAGLQAIAWADRAFTYDAFLRRLGIIFAEFQVAWSARDLRAMRPYLSDGLFQTELYWIETYRREGLTNKTANARITRVELANVIRDARYDAITMRVFAASLDFTVRDADGGIVGGSKTCERAYSEYWTLIRGAGMDDGRATREAVSELRRAPRRQHGGRVRLLQREGHERRVRLGAEPHRAGRGVRLRSCLRPSRRSSARITQRDSNS